jgi:hypothetical protein
MASAASSNVSDFAKDHPAFRLTLPDESGVRRVRQGGAPIEERSHLVFTHAKHLDPRGVRSPTKGPRAPRMQELPPARRLAAHLRADLDDEALPGMPRAQVRARRDSREVPHGKPADAITVIEEFYATSR